ncbi:MAG: acetylxylan esterase [Chitinophagaceae bacterium]|nr:MAG: acetylxylan esterase [Chitinophagaceae bacterium]
MKTILTVLIALYNLHGYTQNYEENRVPPYVLPELLQSIDSGKITTPVNWFSIRRPEIIRLFENNVYGQMPRAYDSLTYSITNQDGGAMKGKALLKEIDITLWRRQKPVTIHLVLFIPVSAKNPPPVFLLMHNRDRGGTDPSRPVGPAFRPAEMVVDSGYAFASFDVWDLAPDDPLHYREGVLQLYPDQLTRPNGMKAVGAWAWGASRVLDYLELDNSVDVKRVAIVGQAAAGKAALWAGATDRRFAYVIAHGSGNGGAALSRRRFGETVSAVNAQSPHWFSDNYRKFNDNVDSLPVDQHMLIAAIAPRGVYVSAASGDLASDPKGSFLAIKHAEEVYGLVGSPSALSASLPQVNRALTVSPIGFHTRESGPDLVDFDWKAYVSWLRKK